MRFVRELPRRGPGLRARDRADGPGVRSCSRSGTSGSSTSWRSSSSTSSTRRRSRRASRPSRSTWRTPSGSRSTTSTRTGTKKRPILMHTSISGSIERVICSILEQQAIRMRNKEVPNFPLWLAPIQVRVIPVSEKHHEFCEALLDEDPVPGRFRRQRHECREEDPRVGPTLDPVHSRRRRPRGRRRGELTVRVHGGEQRADLARPAQLNSSGRRPRAGPTRPLNVPARLSERPIFVG